MASEITDCTRLPTRIPAAARPIIPSTTRRPMGAPSGSAGGGLDPGPRRAHARRCGGHGVALRTRTQTRRPAGEHRVSPPPRRPRRPRPGPRLRNRQAGSGRMRLDRRRPPPGLGTRVRRRRPPLGGAVGHHCRSARETGGETCTITTVGRRRAMWPHRRIMNGKPADSQHHLRPRATSTSELRHAGPLDDDLRQPRKPTWPPGTPRPHAISADQRNSGSTRWRTSASTRTARR